MKLSSLLLLSWLLATPVFANNTNFVLLLDGDYDYVEIPATPRLQNATSLTVEAWAYCEDGSANSSAIINMGDGSHATSDRAYDVRFQPTGYIAVNLFFEDGIWTSLTAPAVVSNWTHVAFTFESTNGMFELYTNGVLAAFTNSIGAAPLQGKTIRQSTQPFLIGGIPPWSDTWFRGAVDEVRVWDRARTQQEITATMSCPLSGMEPNLVAYFNFDSGNAADMR